MKRPSSTRNLVIGGLLGLHLSLYLLLSVLGHLAPFELFNLLLLAFNVIAGVVLLRRDYDLLPSAGMMTLVMAHTFVGHHLAPDALTSGAILMVNILVLYVGIKINTSLPTRHWLIFVASYFLLFAIFILWLDNAEPLFILFLLGMVACARSLRLTAYFWALTASFTFCQPFAWEALFILFFVLTAVFWARGAVPSTAARVFLFAGLVLLFLVLLPVIIVVMGEDLHSFVMVLRDVRLRAAIRTTFLTATVSTLFLVIFAVPLAYAVSRLRFPGRTLLLSLIDLPIVVPQSVAGIALLHVFGRKQILGSAIHDLFGIHIDGTVIGICLAQIFVALPFLAKSAIAAFDSVDEELELTARTLGASSWSVFWRVATPLAARGIFLGAVLAWARAAGEFGAVIFIAPTPETAPVAAYNRFNSVGVAEATPLVAILLLFSLAMFFLLQWVTRFLPGPDASERKGA